MKEISHMMSVVSTSEMKTPKSKHEPVNASVDLRSDEPWDTVKSQILVKISTVINPRILRFDDYLLTYCISRVLPKPGLSLLTQADYDGMMKCIHGMAARATTINISVIQKQPVGEDLTSPLPRRLLMCCRRS
jgi:hypothetical protein